MTTVLTILFVPVVGKRHHVHYKPVSETRQVSAVKCAASERWRPYLQVTETGNPPTPPAPFTRTITMVRGKCVPK